MHVLFASNHSYLPQRAGGSEAVTHEMCVELLRRGHEPGVLATLEPEGWLGLRTRLLRKLPPWRAFPKDRVMGYPVYRGWSPPEGVTEVVGRFRPAVAVVQAGRPIPLAEAFLEKRIPTILYLHDTVFERMGGEVRPRQGLMHLANSRFTAERALRERGVEAEVLPPLVRPEDYRTESTRQRVLFVNPHPLKGVETALALAERRPDIPFEFLESWDLREEQRREYRARARRAGNVVWTERVADMRPLYGRARIVLAPSEWDEPWGRIATEAHISGIPVLASRRGGLPESVGPGGILVDPEAGIGAWEDALSTLWDSEEAYERLSRAALEYARRPEIQPDALIERFVELAGDHARSTW